MYKFETHIAALNEHCDRWMLTTRNVEHVSDFEMTSAVQGLYELLCEPMPLVMFCDSPWQMVTMRGVLECGVTQSQAHEFALGREGNLQADELLWSALWAQIEKQVTPEMLPKLRKKMENMATPFAPLMPSSFPWNDSSSVWASIGHRRKDMRTALLNQLHGTAEAYFGNNPAFAALKDLYATRFAHAAMDDLAAILRMTLLLNSATSLAFVFAPDIVRTLTPRNLANRLMLALSGDTSQLRLYGEEQQTQFAFMTACLIAVAEMSVSASALDWLPFFEYVADNIPLAPFGPKNLKLLHGLLRFFKKVPFAVPTQGVCFVSRPPLIFAVDSTSHLHAESGPCLAFADGYKIFAWHGVIVPDYVIEDPGSISSDKIIAQPNAEIRRVMIERYGTVRFLNESGAEVVHQDECGTLYRKELTFDEPLVMVKVKNSSPEPDGSFREYFIRVPPTVQTAREAVAWTFSMPADEYDPQRQT